MTPEIDVGEIALTAREPGLDIAVATLPRDHPAWQRDVLSVSSRTRTMLAALAPIIVRVRTFWDHAVRAVTLNGRRFEIDPSGSYRLR